MWFQQVYEILVDSSDNKQGIMFLNWGNNHDTALLEAMASSEMAMVRFRAVP